MASGMVPANISGMLFAVAGTDQEMEEHQSDPSAETDQGMGSFVPLLPLKKDFCYR